MKILILSALIGIALVGTAGVIAAAQDEDEGVLSGKTFAGLKLRSLGPALMSGRIADIVIHPDDNNLWYVAVGSGGVWRYPSYWGGSWGEGLPEGSPFYLGRRCVPALVSFGQEPPG